MSFLEVQFPTTLSYRAVGGPGFNTTVNLGLSGQEQRNRNWSKSRGKWTVSLKTPASFANRQQFADLLNAFFTVVGGKADGFRLKDHKDFRAIEQPLIEVDGRVMLGITRTIAGRSYIQPITKPITSAVVDYQGNALPDTVVVSATGAPVSVDYTTGIVSGLSAGTAVNFQYHYPVRFDMDNLEMQVEESNTRDGDPIVSVNSITLIEVLPPGY